MPREERIPIYLQKEVLNRVEISRGTLYKYERYQLFSAPKREGKTSKANLRYSQEMMAEMYAAKAILALRVKGNSMFTHSQVGEFREKALLFFECQKNNQPVPIEFLTDLFWVRWQLLKMEFLHDGLLSIEEYKQFIDQVMHAINGREKEIEQHILHDSVHPLDAQIKTGMLQRHLKDILDTIPSQLGHTSGVIAQQLRLTKRI